MLHQLQTVYRELLKLAPQFNSHHLLGVTGVGFVQEWYNCANTTRPLLAKVTFYLDVNDWAIILTSILSKVKNCSRVMNDIVNGMY